MHACCAPLYPCVGQRYTTVKIGLASAICRKNVDGGRINSLFVWQPCPRPGDVSNWPQRPGPLLAPPVPMIGVNRTIPGIDLHIQSRPAGHPVAVVLAEAHILRALFEELSESLRHPCWKSLIMHAQAVSETRHWLFFKGEGQHIRNGGHLFIPNHP